MSSRLLVAALRDLCMRYAAAWRHAWQHRSLHRYGLLDEHEAEFLPAAQALLEKPISRTARWTGLVLVLLVASALAWSIVGRIDIVVNATGRIIPSGHTKTITAVDVAVVRELKVRDGQKVRAGEVLIELDASAADAERVKALGDVGASNLAMARAHALVAAIESRTVPKLPLVPTADPMQWQAGASHLQGQYHDFKAKMARIEGDIERFSRALPLATQRANDFKALLKDHDVSEHAWQEKEQARIELEGQLADARNQRAVLIAQTRREAQDALAEAARLAASSAQDAKRAGDHSRLLRLTSPVEGTVQQLAVHTIGAAVPAAQPLMLIVPDEPRIEVEAFLENKDIGFVEEGQAAAVKIDAFEYTKYGTVPARVSHVSRDAIQDEKRGLIYSVRLAVDQSSMVVDGRDAPLSAGMSISAEIKTGTRRVIEYVLSPLMQHQREALHER